MVTIMKHQYFWLFPFIFFIAGYYAVYCLIHIESVETPSLVGLSLQDALKAISAVQLQGQILAEKEDEDLPNGFVLDQSPTAGQRIKTSQSIYLTITKKPVPLRAPGLLGLQKKTIDEQVCPQKIRVKYHEIESRYPINYCYAQYPAPGDVVEGRTMHAYLSSGITSTRIFPQCKGLSVTTVREFLQQQGMTAQIFHTAPVAIDHVCSTCLVRDQKPLVGTLFDIKKPLTVQLIVEE